MLLGATTLLLAASAAVHAADWSTVPAMSIGTRYVINPRLLADSRPHDTALSAELSLPIMRKSELTDYSLTSQVSGTRYRSDPSLDHDEQSLLASFAHRGERVTWTADAGAQRDTTLTSELGVTGLTQATLRHQRLSASLAAERQLAALVSLSTQLSWERDSYEQGQSNGLTDYQYSTASIFSSYQASTTARWTLTAMADRFDLPGNANSSNDIAVRLGFRYSTSPAWVLSFDAGPSRVQTDNSQRSGWVVALQADRRSERATLSLAASRGVKPSGRSTLTLTDDITVNFGWAVTERLQSALQLRAVRSRDLVPVAGIPYLDLKYGAADASMSWRWTEALTLSGRVGSNGQRDTFAPGTRSGAYGSLNLSWSGNWGTAAR
jgi:hypothetical protein